MLANLLFLIYCAPLLLLLDDIHYKIYIKVKIQNNENFTET